MTITWDARDPDGSVDHVSYALDPPTGSEVAAGAETTWTKTTAGSVLARFRAATPDPNEPGRATDFHVFVARAWDNSGGASELVVRAFYATTVAPSSRILNPAPHQAQVSPVPRTVTIRFTGDDPDGSGSREPVGYRVRLVNDQDPLFRAIVKDPDALRRDAMANEWRGWSLLPGDQTSYSLANMPEDTEWMFAVAAVDAAGAVTPVFSFETNLLRLYVSDTSGPRLRVLGPGLDFTFAEGSNSLDPSRWLHSTFPSGSQPDFQWSAFAAPGRAITGYRWVLDPDTLDSETPRSDERADTKHWSAWSPTTRSTGPLGPWTPGEHMLYIQVRDDLESRSIAVLELLAYAAAFERSLLVVDDTRFELDRRAPGGCLATYTKAWPSATELDTFLYARGGVPWRCATFDPGAISPRGLFADYDPDTVGTRLGADPMTRMVPLELLTRYRNVIWLTDQEGATSPSTSTSPLAMMRWMSRPENANPLEDYVRLGGNLWLAGGGTMIASLVERDVSTNNSASNVILKDGELNPRSPVVTLAHLRSELNATRVAPVMTRSATARGGWSGHGLDRLLAAPDYARLPAALALRSSATDPIPPTRSPSQPSLFYPSSVAMETSLFSELHEDFGDPGAPRVESALDTLFEVAGATIRFAPAPAMLYYHGRENPPVLFSGFDLWSWSRTDAQALVDFVLDDVWGLSQSAPGVRATSRPTPAAAMRRNAKTRPDHAGPAPSRRPQP